jgi:predicted glycosyltransferase
MARESCILGVPNIYTGGRDMKANKEFIKIGGINKCDSVNDIINSIDKVIKGKSNNFDEIIKDKFKYEWDDLTKLIVNSIN